MMKLLTLKILTVTACCLHLNLGAAPLPTELPRSGKVVVDFQVRGKGKLEFVTQPRAALPTREMNTYLESGPFFGETGNSDSAILYVRMSWGKLRPVHLAISAFSDLFNPDSVLVTAKGESILLTIVGGDASVSYRADIEVAPHGVSERRVFNKKSGYQETIIYSYPKEFVETVQRELKAQLNEEGRKLEKVGK